MVNATGCAFQKRSAHKSVTFRSRDPRYTSSPGRATRRRFTAAEKARILDAHDGASDIVKRRFAGVGMTAVLVERAALSQTSSRASVLLQVRDELYIETVTVE